MINRLVWREAMQNKQMLVEIDTFETLHPATKKQ